MGQTDKVEKLFKPNADTIRKHLEFIVSGMGACDDGRIEVGYLNKASNFMLSDLDKAVTSAVDFNTAEKSTYFVPALLDPDVFPSGRSSDADFYATSVLWADIDDPHDPDELKALYALCPPNRAVVTARTPHRRIQLWWKLDEPCMDGDTVTEALAGIQQALNSDPKVKNRASLMRLAGTVNYPSDKKRGEGRVTEMTEYVEIHDKTYNIEQVLSAFPVKNYDSFHSGPDKTDKTYSTTQTSPFEQPRISDGREKYMSGLVFASILHMTAKLGAWPSVDQVMADAWPTYEKHVTARDGRTLDQDGRGAKTMRQKIASKLRLFVGGGMSSYGLGTLDQVIKAGKVQNKKPESPAPDEEFDPETGEVGGGDDALNILDWIASEIYSGPAPEIKWLIEGTFQQGIPALVAAMGGLGKSFSLLDLCIEIAGPPRLAPKRMFGGSVADHGRCVFLTAEDGRASIHRRIEKICPQDRLARTKENLMVVPMPEIGGPKVLIRDGSDGLKTTEFFDEILSQLAAIPDLKLVVFDPLQAFVSADITSKPEAGQFMWNAFACIAAQTGATVLCSHHMRKDGLKNIETLADAKEAIRGTTAMIDGARLAYAMWQAGTDAGKAIASLKGVDYEPQNIVMGGVVKANDAENREMTSYIRGESGLLEDVGVLNVCDPEYIGMTMDQCREALREIKKKWEAGSPFKSTSQSPDYLVKWLSKTYGITKKSAREQMENWLRPPGIDQSPLVEERAFKDKKRMDKLGLYVIRIP